MCIQRIFVGNMLKLQIKLTVLDFGKKIMWNLFYWLFVSGIEWLHQGQYQTQSHWRPATRRCWTCRWFPYSILISLARDIGADLDIDYELQLGLTIDLPLIGDIIIPLSQKGEIKLLLSETSFELIMSHVFQCLLNLFLPL